MSEPVPRLTTERLVLRGLTADDAPAVERHVSTWEVAQMTLNIPHPYPEGGAATWIAGQAAAWESRAHLSLAISRIDTRELIGVVSLSLLMAHLRGELGYWIARDSWGQGYATEASRALIDYGFRSLGLHRIQARHFLRNPASGRVLEKLGMRREGVHRGAYRRWDNFEDSVMYAILDDEWKAAAPR